VIIGRFVKIGGPFVVQTGPIVLLRGRRVATGAPFAPTKAPPAGIQGPPGRSGGAFAAGARALREDYGANRSASRRSHPYRRLGRDFV
jgi:hypothetical protein